MTFKNKKCPTVNFLFLPLEMCLMCLLKYLNYEVFPVLDVFKVLLVFLKMQV